MAKYTFEEFKKLRDEHSESFEVIEYIDSHDNKKALETIMSYFKKNELYSVTLTRPIVTLETFKTDFGFWQYLTNEVRLTSFSYYPALGWFAFFKNNEDRDKFNDMGEWKESEVSNYKHVDVYEKGVELVRKDDSKEFYEFDEIIFE